MCASAVAKVRSDPPRSEALSIASNICATRPLARTGPRPKHARVQDAKPRSSFLAAGLQQEFGCDARAREHKGSATFCSGLLGDMRARKV